MVLGLVCACGAAVLFGGSAVLQAVAVRRSGLVSWLMVPVVVGYVLGWLLHLVAIATLPLYLAQMAIGGSLAVTALIASRVVHEPLERRHWQAVCAMAFGFGLLILSAGAPGEDNRYPHLTLVLYVCVALLGILGGLVARRRGARSGAVLGLLAGLAYAGAPIATRALVDPAFDLRTVVPALPVALFGVLGFLLQSLALERSSVTAALAPMVLFETFVPAGFGVFLFGDEVRHGWGLVALLSFVVATAGTVVLSGAEERLDHLEEPVPDPAATHDTTHDTTTAQSGVER